MLTKVHNRMIENADVNVKDFGAIGDGVADDTAAIQAAFDAVGTNGEVYFPAGTYKTSSAINATCSFYGDGSGTIFRPSGGHEAFIVRAGRADRPYAERIGSFVIDFGHLGSVTSADIGLWLSKGSTPPANSGCYNTTFSNIMINKAYRGIQMLNTDLGNLWNTRFESIIITGSGDHGIYIDTTGTNGSLNVGFDTVTIDGLSSATAKGAYIRGIPNMSFFGVSTAITGGSGSCLTVSDCSNVDVRVQIESATTTSAISGLVAFLNCPTVEVSLTSQTCTFDQGAGNDASYIYADANVKTITVRAVNNAADVYTSGTTYKLNVGFGVSSTKLCILDQNVVASDAYASAAVKAATKWPDTNYALEKTATTRRTQALDVSIAVGATANLVSVADYASRPYQVAGLYIVQGSKSTDNTVGFTDLVLVTGVGQAVAQTVVVVSGNSINGGEARTYGVSGGFLTLSVAHVSGNYIVSATGFDQAGSAN